MIFNTFRRTIVFPALIGLTGLPAIAHAETASKFVRDGVTYTYTARQVDGRTVLIGKANEAPFRLVVSENKVSGEFNHKPITFSLAEVQDTAKQVAVR